MSEQASEGNSEIFIKPGFDLENSIKSAVHPLVEIAGPTPEGYELLGGRTLQQLKDAGQKILITAFPPEKVEYDPAWETEEATDHQKIMLEIWKGNEEWYRSKYPQVDTLMDATQASFKDSSIGGYFSASLPRQIVTSVESEVLRTLVPNGFWVVQRMSGSELENAQKIGFDIGYKSDISRVHPMYGPIYKNIVLLKPAVPSPAK